MTETELRAELQESEVYLVTTKDRESVIGEYAGTDGEGNVVLMIGATVPLHIPSGKVAEWERLT